MKKLFALFATTLVLAQFSVRAEPRTEATAVTPSDNSRHGNFLRQIAAAKGDFGFLLIGDSITDRFPGNGKASYAEFQAWKPLDLGVSGERTEQVLYRLLNGELDNIKPKAAMIMIGTNNLGQAADEKPEWTAAGVKKILETVRQKLPDTKILLLAIFPRGKLSTDPIQERLNAANKIIATFGDGKMVTYMDISSKFLGPDGNVDPALMPDYLHPNEAGYKVWVDAVKPVLDEMMK